jgi:hypothetical protein
MKEIDRIGGAKGCRTFTTKFVCLGTRGPMSGPLGAGEDAGRITAAACTATRKRNVEERAREEPVKFRAGAPPYPGLRRERAGHKRRGDRNQEAAFNSEAATGSRCVAW